MGHDDQSPVENEKMKLLYTAIVKAQGMAHGIEKDARNQFHKYNYVSAEMMIREAKEILVACGLAIVPQAATLSAPIVPCGDMNDAEWVKNSRSSATLHASWLLVHSMGGSLALSASWPVAPEKGRPVDKAAAAARTASLSYLLRDLLQIPRVEEGTDLDGDERDRHREETHRPAADPKRYAARAGSAVDARISVALDKMGVTAPAQRANAIRSVLRRDPVSDADLKAVADELEARANAR